MRSLLYKLARAIGDAKAVSKGPTKIVKRVERRLLGGMFSKLMGKLIPR